MKWKSEILSMICVLITAALFSVTKAQQKNVSDDEVKIEYDTRRIIGGAPVGDTRPYMVYLVPATQGPDTQNRSWTCGGVIIHTNVILTSAACIEDVQAFYVVAGTDKWVPYGDTENECVKNGAKRAAYQDIRSEMMVFPLSRPAWVPSGDTENECVKNGAKRAAWKLIPKGYVFDGLEYENIKWMSQDIAVVKLEESFNFEKRVRGCDYIPTTIDFNVTEKMLKPGTTVTIAGWGSKNSFGDDVPNSQVLLEAEVKIISAKSCKSRWPERYHFIIDGNMICTDDTDFQGSRRLTHSCDGVACEPKEGQKNQENEGETRKIRFQNVGARRLIPNPETFVHSGHHQIDRRSGMGGICQNDHGGPLIHGQGKTAVVIGVISACQNNDVTKRCFGPYLYTSVLSHRLMINCAMNTNDNPDCQFGHFQKTLFHWPEKEEEVETIL